MRSLFALIVTAAFTLPAYGQFQFDAGMRGGGTMLLRSDDVQKDLKLSDEQKEKVKAFQAKQSEAMREFFPQGGGNVDREKIQEGMKKAQEESAKFIKEALTEDQAKRLKQIGLQSA